jgi:hypothetical protein
MGHGKTRGVGDVLLLVGLALTVIGLMTVMTRLAAHPASSPSFSSERNGNSIASSPSTTLHVRLSGQGAHSTVPPDPVARQGRGAQGDARLDLRDTATMARWYLWARPGRGETRTDLWINAPASIGSTSPPDASPAHLFPEE